MKKSVALIVKLTITVGLLYFAVGRANFAFVAQRMQQLDVAWFAAAVSVACIQTVFSALRWRAILEQCGAAVSIYRALFYTLASLFFSQVLPSTIGGDAARIWLVARDGAGLSKAIYSVLIDRISGVMVLAAAVLLGIPVSFSLIDDRVARGALLALGVLGVTGPIGLVALGRQKWTVLDRFPLLRQVNAAAHQTYEIFTSARAASLIMLLSFVIQALTIVVAWLAAKSVAPSFTLGDSILLTPPVLLIATIPISIAGWGVRESAMVLAFSYAGLPQSDGLLVSALFGLANFAVGIFGGLIWLIAGRRETAFAIEKPSVPP